MVQTRQPRLDHCSKEMEGTDSMNAGRDGSLTLRSSPVRGLPERSACVGHDSDPLAISPSDRFVLRQK